MLLVLAGMSQHVRAQAGPDAGTLLRDISAPRLRVPPPSGVDIEQLVPLRPALQSNQGTRVQLNGFRVSGNANIPSADLLSILVDYIGLQVTLADLQEAAARISAFYRERGFLVARAYLPEQDVDAGVVEIAVVEGRFGKVTVLNGSRVRDSVIEEHKVDFAGNVVTQKELERKLLLLNDLPGVAQARAWLEPGSEVGSTDLSTSLAASPAITGSIELDNFGNRFTGGDRMSARLNLLSPSGLGDSVTLQASRGFNGLSSARLAYQVPIGGDGLRLGINYTRSDYQLGRDFAALDANGTSHAKGLSLGYPIVRSRELNLSAQLELEGRRLQDSVGATASSTRRAAQTATLSISGDFPDNLGEGGVSAFSLGLVRGQVNIKSAAALAADSAGPRTQGDFGKWTLAVLRQQNLGNNWSMLFSFNGQRAGKNLDSSEKLVLGGAHGVRAYPQGEAVGDSGYVASVELRLSQQFPGVPGLFQPFVFVDAGSVRINHSVFAAGTNRRQLTGAGLGLGWTHPQGLEMRLTVATRLGNEPANSDSDRSLRAWLHASLPF